jgi:hypothetical protein
MLSSTEFQRNHFWKHEKNILSNGITNCLKSYQICVSIYRREWRNGNRNIHRILFWFITFSTGNIGLSCMYVCMYVYIYTPLCVLRSNDFLISRWILITYRTDIGWAYNSLSYNLCLICSKYKKRNRDLKAEFGHQYGRLSIRVFHIRKYEMNFD